MKPPDVRYVAVIAPVCEVILAGTADLAYWRERLGRDGLFPYAAAGRAGLLISAMASSFRGLPFREFSVSVAVSRQSDGATHDDVFLAHACNSSRLLAFAERALFQTPYVPADIRVVEQPPVSIAAADSGTTRFAAALAPETPRAGHEAQDWEGAIYLPGGEKVFYARLAGPTEVYPFTAADTLTIQPGADDAALRQLVDSGFSGREWRVRAAATHSRSKTYRRER